MKIKKYFLSNILCEKYDKNQHLLFLRKKNHFLSIISPYINFFKKDVKDIYWYVNK